MSPIGKIFLVLNIVLAAAFVGWAYSSLQAQNKVSQNLAETRAKVVALQSELDSKVEMLNAEKAQLRQEKDGAMSERDAQKSRADGLAGQLSEEKSAAAQLRGDVTKYNERLADYNKRLDSVESAKDRAVAAQRSAESDRDAAVDAQREAELAQRNAQDEASAARQQAEDLMAQLESTRKEARKLDSQLSSLIDYTKTPLSAITSQPLIEAAVLDVKMDVQPGLVMLNVGRSKGVLRGMTFEIYAGSQYKGQVRVENVQDNMCSALVSMAVKDAKIGQGDLAATRL